MTDPATWAREIEKALRAVARAARSGTVDGYSSTALEVLGVTVPDLRGIVRKAARETRGEKADRVLDLARRLVAGGTLEGRQVAYELLGRRADARAVLRVRQVESLGAGNDNWKSVDAFACEVTGRCWREGVLTDAALRRWARSPDPWWRRTALVSTVPLNLKSRGGTGDPDRTLAICALVAADREDAVVKAASWALRQLAAHLPAVVRTFLDEHGEILAPRVLREVRSKLKTGRKNA